MIIIAIIRISKMLLTSYAADIIWVIFWQQAEACIAVIMASFSAFRSFFVARDSRRREDQNRHRHWYMSKKNQMAAALRRRRLLPETEEMDQLPDIPRATMTGMSTFIREGKTNNESRVSSLDAGVMTTESPQR